MATAQQVRSQTKQGQVCKIFLTFFGDNNLNENFVFHRFSKC